MAEGRPPVIEAVRLVSLLARGELDQWIDSVALVALRRRNSIRRRNARLSKDPSMNFEQTVRVETAWSASTSSTAMRLSAALGRSIADMTTAELEELGWSLSLLAGVLDAEVERRAGTTDMAALPSAEPNH